MLGKGFLFTLTILILISGCVSLLQEGVSHEIDAKELMLHVDFLAQPALKGRKPRTWESKTVQQYLQQQFDAYGLQPWSTCEEYRQSFTLGTNVIGVLPGSDPELADEIVILGAHYDHLGTDEKGIYYGACDNAAGVAAILEIAEHLSMESNRPRRTVCFAAFDCEETMMLGSFAFTCREDYQHAKIAAMVNIDLLGREFLDVVDESLFVIGTEPYPKLRETIVNVGKQRQTKILTIGSDIVGPRGDHVPFETLDVPVLFFSCGLYKDYHKVTDTPSKIDYNKMQRSTSVIAKTIKYLANTQHLGNREESDFLDRQEMQSVTYIFDKVSSQYKKAGLTQEQHANLQKRLSEMKAILSSEQSSQQQRAIISKSLRDMLPESIGKEKVNTQLYLMMNEIYAEQSSDLIELHRGVVCQFIKENPGAIKKASFSHKVYHAPEKYISFVQLENDQYELDVIIDTVDATFKAKMIGSPKSKISIATKMIHFIGTLEETVDYCLLQWREHRSDPSWSDAWLRVLRRLRKDITPDINDYNGWFAYILSERGLSDEAQWLASLQSSSNKRLTEALTLPHPQEKGVSMCELIRDKNADVNNRLICIWILQESSCREELFALADVLDDETPGDPSESRPRYMDKSYPFPDHWQVQSCRKFWQERADLAEKYKTIGNIAEYKLKQITKQDFGKNKQKWRRWIEANRK